MDLEVHAPAAGRLEVRELEQRDPSAGEVRVRMRRCGICGSDLHFFQGRSPLPIACPGHEISGVVDAVGTGVSGWREGDRVAIEPLQRCRTCRRCRKGDYHLCPELQLFGVNLPGGMASSLLVPAYCLHRLPGGIDFELGALCEPTAVCVHAARLAGIGGGWRVLVLGAGSIGLLAAVAARHLGASFVAITAKYPPQRRLAEQLGCNQVLDPTRAGEVAECPDAVIETVGGTATTVEDAVFAVDRGGTIVIVGLFDEAPRYSPLVALLKEVRMVGSMVYNRPAAEADFDTAIAVLTSRGEALRPLLTHSFPLEQAQQAFETAANKASGAVKVLLSG